MFITDTRDKQELLNEIIMELSRRMIGKKELELYLDRLRQVYDGEFKHRYSEFYPIIVEIFKDDNEMNSDYLTNNLYELSTYLEQENLDMMYAHVKKPFTKLCDHLNLQISQFSYASINNGKLKTVNRSLKKLQFQIGKIEEMLEDTNNQLAIAEQWSDDNKQREKKIEDRLQQAEEWLESILDDSEDKENQLRKAAKKLKKVEKQVKSSQIELISVLSIFAAIVITFSSGYGFLENSLAALASVEYCEAVILTMLICGLVIFNTIFLLMFLMARITKRSIVAKCMQSSDSDCMNCKEACDWFKRVKRRLPYVYYFNLFALLGIIIDMIVWVIDMHCDWI